MVRPGSWQLLICTALACASGPDAHSVSPGPAEPAAAAALEVAPGSTPAPAVASEVEARAVLAERFRAAGLRVRYDVRVEDEHYSLTADGYDPEAGVGFEYIAADERGLEVSPAERAAMARGRARLLVLDAMPLDEIAAAADAFLRALGR